MAMATAMMNDKSDYDGALSGPIGAYHYHRSKSGGSIVTGSLSTVAYVHKWVLQSSVEYSTISEGHFGDGDCGLARIRFAAKRLFFFFPHLDL